MSLTDLQKRAGRTFRHWQQAALDAENLTSPPGGDADPLHRVVRHACPRRGGASIGITLREHREVSPAYMLCYCGRVGECSEEFPHWDCAGATKIAAEAGLLAFIWKDGRCPDCGLVLRSSRGRVALAADLPPIKERAVAG